MKRTKRGFTLIELLVVIAIIALLIGLLLPALAKAQRRAKSVRDQAQIKQVHQAMLIFAEDDNGYLPTPGRINRLIDTSTGLHLPNRGAVDMTRNHSAPMYSALIAQNFFNTDIVVGQTETNPAISQLEEFDYGAYRPDQDSYWDDNFQCDLVGGSNASYFHMSICGKRRDSKYRNTQAGTVPVVSTRGTRDGAITGPEFARSQTLDLHGGERDWTGFVAMNDNSTKKISSPFPPGVAYEPQEGFTSSVSDNIFAAEFTDFGAGPASNDAWLTMSTAAAASGNEVTTTYDELLF